MVDIIRILRLVEVGFAIVSVPLKHVSKGVLAGETIANDVVSIDLESSVDWVLFIGNFSTHIMISSPQPGVVNNDISTVDLKHTGSFNFSFIWTSNTCEDVMHCTRISCISFESSFTPFEKCISLRCTCLKKDS